jgi:hypothetical protein
MVIDKVVTKKRIERVRNISLLNICQLKEDPLKLSEFIAPLSKAYCIVDEEYLKIRVLFLFTLLLYRHSQTKSPG